MFRHCAKPRFLFAAVIGTLFLKESFGVRQIFAAAIITIGIVVMQMPEI